MMELSPFFGDEEDGDEEEKEKEKEEDEMRLIGMTKTLDCRMKNGRENG